MLSIPSIFAGVLALVSVVQSAPASLDAEPNSVSSYSMVPISWDLPVKLDDPTGDKVTVTGTIQEAIAQMEASYPGWNATFQAQLPPVPADDGTSSLISSSGLEDPETYDCNVDYKVAGFTTIIWGIRYLRGVPGTAKNGPGPNNCGRVSCSWHSAIYWCNYDDNDNELEWNDIADAAATTNHQCKTNRGLDVKGRGNMKDKWNVLIRGDDC